MGYPRVRAVNAALAVVFAALVMVGQPPAVVAESGATPYLAGQLLVAVPKMPDPRFAKTVILMINHDSRGAFGLVINRVIGEGRLSQLLDGVGIDHEGVEGSDEIRLHWGGPVELDRMFVLHSPDYDTPASERVSAGVSVTAHASVLEAMAAGTGPERSRVVIGYAGWGPGQLESEFQREDWLTVPNGDALVFDGDAETIWERAYRDAGLSL